MTTQSDCTHRPATATAVIRSAGPLDVPVECPCCHLPGYREVGDLEPMYCPYCDRKAVDAA